MRSCPINVPPPCGVLIRLGADRRPMRRTCDARVMLNPQAFDQVLHSGEAHGLARHLFSFYLRSS